MLIYSSILIALGAIWYQGIFKGHFTFFDDSLEWLQMDKVGHFFAAFQISRWFIQILRWQKVSAAEAQKVGIWGGIIYLCPVEILDGFSEAYGFSWTDILANCLGTGFLWLQLQAFKKMNFLPKFSFQLSPFAVMRKEMLGSHLFSQLIKDYNGQTYWLSFSPNVFFKKKYFPEWLQISIGYGADNLLGGHDNVWKIDGQNNVLADYSHLARTRQFFISFDISLQYKEYSNPFMKFVRLALSCLKFPFPAIGFSANKGFEFKWLGI